MPQSISSCPPLPSFQVTTTSSPCGTETSHGVPFSPPRSHSPAVTSAAPLVLSSGGRSPPSGVRAAAARTSHRSNLPSTVGPNVHATKTGTLVVVLSSDPHSPGTSNSFTFIGRHTPCYYVGSSHIAALPAALATVPSRLPVRPTETAPSAQRLMPFPRPTCHSRWVGWAGSAVHSSVVAGLGSPASACAA